MLVSIRPAIKKDLAKIEVVEHLVEQESPASYEVLLSRLEMFQDGFLTAWHGKELVGYAQSCLWNEKTPVFGKEADFFCRRHRADGMILYIIFIGVQPCSQRHGIGSVLINSFKETARANGVKRIQAVTWPHLEKLYTNQDFIVVGELPGFLPSGEFRLLEFRLDGL